MLYYLCNHQIPSNLGTFTCKADAGLIWKRLIYHSIMCILTKSSIISKPLFGHWICSQTLFLLSFVSLGQDIGST
jgi:hypothetical protein